MQRSWSRRDLLITASAAAPMLNLRAASQPGIAIAGVTFDYEEFRYRTPYKFGGVEVDRVTLLNVRCTVRDRAGKTAQGFGSMPMGNVWAFPSRTLPYDRTLDAMKRLATRIASITRAYTEYGHPIDINTALEPEYLRAAAELSKTTGLDQPVPKLCTLVTASPFDAAIHDAFGKLHNRSCYATYGPDLMPNDLSHYLGADFRGEHLDRYVRRQPAEWVHVFHSVGASDPITADDITHPVRDGLPETLPDWIRRDGITHIKIKLNGDDRKWDVDRVLRIDQAACSTANPAQLAYSLDFNERCPNVSYLLEFVRDVQARNPAAFARMQYIEQPTRRDLEADRGNVMHQAAKLKPVVIDESLTGLDMLLLARDIGYTGVALKACKGQSQAMLMAAAAQKYGMFLCVQDLTCPGAALIHSAGIAAHVPGVSGIEANAREYVPVANQPWEARFPGIFRLDHGRMKTAGLTGPGLGAV